jgi:protein-S-isoprenylcysteine O-methyltransferase Ste14
MKRRIRFQGILIASGVIFFLVFPRFFFQGRESRAVDVVLELAGFVVVVLGYLVRISARGHKSLKSSQGAALVTDGPYAVLRNPMYFGTLLIGLGFILMFAKPWFLVAFAAAYLGIYIPQVKAEEERLRKHFGDAYAQYASKTPRIFPDILRLWKGGVNDFLPLRKSWIRRELPSFVSCLGVMILLKIWQGWLMR